MWSFDGVNGLATMLGLLLSASAERPRLTVDTHLHVTMSQAAKPIFWGEPGSGVLTKSPRTQAMNQIEADQLIRAHGQLAIAALWPPFRMRPGRKAIDEALHQLDALREFCRREPDFAMVRTPQEARQVIARGRIALVPGIEGGEGIHSADDVDRLYAGGARSITLVHFSDTQLGGAARGQFAYNVFGKLVDGLNPNGLTELGREAVMRMLELGMVVDLAHASDETSRATLEVAESHGVPIINSHGCSRSLLPMERNITDELAARIARGGGMVGLSAYDKQCRNLTETDTWDGYVPGSCDDLIANWKHLAGVVPAAQLNLGSDFNGMIRRPPPGGSCPNGIRNTGDLPELYDALVHRGFPVEAIDGMGWRFLELWEAVEKRSSPEAKEHAREADPRASSPFDVAM